MPKPWTILTLAIRSEADVVLARQRARQIGASLGFDTLPQTRLATAVSEIARNAFRYAGGGRVQYAVDPTAAPPLFLVQISDAGPGISDADQRLDGSPRVGQSSGLLVAQRLVDHFQVDSASGRGTTITLGTVFPPSHGSFSREDLARVVDELTQRPPASLLEELQQQHQELLTVLEDLTIRQEELRRLNTELEETNRGVLALYSQVTQELDDTNRGVLALYAELDDRAEQLRRANYLRGQFISYLTHEFRTPLRSSVALSDFLLAAVGQPMGGEQAKQVGLIRSGSLDLLHLVDDLLDLAKIDAGKIDVQPEEFTVSELFGALRGMLRPLAASDAVTLLFEEDGELPPLRTDLRKLTQILRNLLSNALKFTERGEIRVSARADARERTITFAVSDTGIGIAPEDQQRIFEDFAQAINPFQRRVHGTGLGLPLSRRLSDLLGGEIRLESTLGVGSTFRVTIPREHVPTPGEEEGEPGSGGRDATPPGP